MLEEEVIVRRLDESLEEIVRQLDELRGDPNRFARQAPKIIAAAIEDAERRGWSKSQEEVAAAERRAEEAERRANRLRDVLALRGDPLCPNCKEPMGLCAECSP